MSKDERQTREDAVEFGYWFKSMRKSAGLTIQDVSDELGIAIGTISRWENGTNTRINNKDYVEYQMKKLVKREIARRRQNERW